VPNESLTPELNVTEYLKQRFPFLMVDRVLSWEKGGKLRAVKSVSVNEFYFQGHFPQYPMFPGVLTVECFAQTAAILVRLTELTEGSAQEDLLDVIGTILEFRFLKPVFPGDRLETEVSITKTVGKNRIVDGKCFVSGEEVAGGKLVFGKIQRP